MLRDYCMRLKGHVEASNNLKDLTVRYYLHCFFISPPISKSTLLPVQAYWQDEDMQLCTLLDLANISVLNSNDIHSVNNTSYPCQPVDSQWDLLQTHSCCHSAVTPFFVFTLRSLPARPTALKWPSAAMIAGTVRAKAPTLVDQQPPPCVPSIIHVSSLSSSFILSSLPPLCSTLTNWVTSAVSQLQSELLASRSTLPS